MPRVTLTFDLPEERAELWTALRGGIYASALWDIDQRCRSALKHGSGRLDAADLDEIRAEIAETRLYDEE